MEIDILEMFYCIIGLIIISKLVLGPGKINVKKNKKKHRKRSYFPVKLIDTFSQKDYRKKNLVQNF